MSKTLVIIHSIHQVKSLKHEQQRDLHIVALDYDVHSVLSKEGIKHDYHSEPLGINVYYKTVQFLNNLSNTPIENNKNFKELFVCEGLSVWWFLEAVLFSGCLYFNSLGHTIEAYTKIEQIIKNYNPSKIMIIDLKDDSSLLIEALAQKYKIIVSKKTPLNVYGKIQQFLSTTKGYMYTVPLKRLRTIVRKAWWRVLKPIQKVTPQSILFFSTPKKRYFDPKDQVIKDGMYGDPIIAYIDAPTGYIDIPFDYDMGFHSLWQLRKKSNSCIFEAYSSRKTHNKASNTRKKIQNLWKQHRQTISKALKYNNVSFAEIILPDLDFFFSTYILDSLREFYTFEHLVQTTKPSMIVSFGATTGILGRITLFITKQNNVPLLEIEHGVIDYSPFHAHEKKDISSKEEIVSSSIPIPTKIAAFGDFQKQFLIKEGNLNPEWIETTGNSNFDILYYAQQKFDKKQIYEELYLDSNKKIILLTSQPLNSKEEHKAVLEAVYETCSKFNNVQVIVKLHPREASDYWHKTLAKKVGIKNIIFLSDYSIEKLIYICDVMLSAFSTCVLEAAYLDKQSFLIDLNNQGYGAYFGNSPAVPVTHNKEELYQQLHEFFNDDSYRKELEKARETFAFEQCYKNDGKASKRIAELILKMKEDKKP